MEDISTFAKRKGFVYPSSEIYDGFSGVYDYGPLGVELVNNIKKIWWRDMVHLREDIVGLDSGIFMNPKIWEASGHTKNFADPFVICKKTGVKFRADHLLNEIGIDADERMDIDEFVELFEKNKDKIVVDGCDSKDLSKPVFFNMLVESNLGNINETDKEKSYLRGETCQGIYVNYKNVVDTMHVSIPFGIAQIGKAFRNEISPRQFLFRTREFEQMEMQYFTHPKDADKFFKHFLEYRFNSLLNLGIKKENLKKVKHKRLVFYAKAATDIEYKYDFGFKELEGIHNRGDYDLTQHSKHCGVKLDYFNQETNERFIPNIVETSIGIGRVFLALLNEAYDIEKLPDKTERVVLRFKKEVAPIYVSVLPLMKKPELVKKAKEVFNLLNKEFVVMYDESQSIGKRYRRQDEIGTPYCVTIDYETLEDKCVTIRDRDSMEQKRVKIDDLVSSL